MYGGWSLIARDPTRDHWAMSVVGLELAIARWIGGYAGDGAAWVSCRWRGSDGAGGRGLYRRRRRRGDRKREDQGPGQYQARHGISVQDAATVPTEPVDSADVDQPRELVDALPIRPRHGAD
jgi:hypothetical protein